MKILVTGGAGFIGSALVRYLIREEGREVVNVDKLTYAANEQALESVNGHPDYYFEEADICNRVAIQGIFQRYQPDAVVHMAAESHVDRSIQDSSTFIQTNIVGTHCMLEESLTYFRKLKGERREKFRFLHVSTDEVYGELGATGSFLETSSYRPNSPYSASKASADHLTRAWHRTYGLPTMQTNSSNNYGPWQNEEKLIPLIVRRALAGKSLPVYGSGRQVRDWLYVDDNARGIARVLHYGRIGESYNIGGNCEIENLKVVTSICAILDELIDNKPAGVINFRSLICHVNDRPGHDFRYALDTDKVMKEIGWSPKVDFGSGLRNTIQFIMQSG